MIMHVKRWTQFIIIMLILNVSFLLATSHFAMAGENDRLLHQQQMQEHYIDAEKRLLNFKQRYDISIEKTNYKQSTFLFMELEGEQTGIPVYTVNDLANISNDMSGSYILMTDLDLSVVPDWTPLVGPSGELFTGTFDGNGYTISNLRSTQGGLFYGNDGGTIKNISLVDVNIYTTGLNSYDVGAISGFSLQGLITNCTVSGQIASYKDASGITAYVYQTTVSNCNGNLLTVTDPASHTTTMEYDDNNNLLLVENALEKQSTFTYDSNGNLIKTTDSLGNETLYNYDESGLLLSTTTPDTGLGSGTTIYTYQNGLMQTVTDPAENTTTYSYNAAGQPITITDNAGKTSAMTYDDAGNLLTVADPLGNTTSYTYDWRCNILTKTDARGNTSSYTYNNNGLLVSKIDALNNETGYEYDAENRLVKVTDPRGNITQLSYDDLGRLTGVTNPLGDTITNQYDAAGNLIGRIDALGNQVLTVTYDELYNPKNMTDALGNNVSFDEYEMQ